MGYFTHFNSLTMGASLSNRLLVTAIVCSFLLQGCRSGLRAITEEPTLKQDYPTTAGHVQASGEALFPGTLVLTPSHTSARVSGTLGSMPPTELVTAAVPTYPRDFMGPFTASSGERVLLRRQQGQWQAFLQGGAGAVVHRRPLPVVSSGDIAASLKALQGQGAWSSRSRIHVLAAPHMSSTPCVYVGKLGLLGGMPEAAVEEEDGWVLGPELLIESSGKEDVTVYQIPSGYRYKTYKYKEKVLENVSVFKIYYVAANNEEEVRKLEALKSRRLVEGKLSAAINLPFGYVADLGHVEGVGNSLVVKGSGSVHTQRSKHAALVVYGSTKKNKTFSSQKEKSRIKVVLKVFLEEDTAPPQDIPSSPTNVHNHAQPSPYASYPLANVPPTFMMTSWPAASFPSQEQLRRDYEDQLYEVRASRDRLQRDYEDQLYGVRASRDRAESALKQKERDYERLVEAHAASQVALKREREQLAEAETARQTAASALAQKEEQLHTKEQEYKRLVEAHKQECARLAKEHKTQLARQESLYQTAETARQTAASALAQKEQECKRLAEDHAALQTALEREREQSTTAAEEHKTQLANQALLYQRSEEALKQKGRDYERLVEAYQQLAQVLVSSVVFGAEQWAQYFGEVEPVPPPLGIDQILSGACPFWPGKQVKDTHLLVLIPSKVDGKPFSLDLLGELIQHPRGRGHSTKYHHHDSGLTQQFGTQSLEGPYWVLMTRDVLKGSRNKTYAFQKAMVAGHAKRTSLPYELPGALEAATAILSHYVRSEERLYTDDPWTFSRCRELVDGEYPAVVGGFSSGGLIVDGDGTVDYRNGVAGLRKF